MYFFKKFLVWSNFWNFLDSRIVLFWLFPELLKLSSVQFSYLVVFNSFRPHEPQHARPPCPSPSLGVYSNSRPLSWWCHLTISSSVVPLFSCLHSFPASGSFQMSQLFASGGQRIGVSASASVLPMTIQDFLFLLLLNFLQDGPVWSCSPRDSQDIAGNVSAF